MEPREKDIDLLYIEDNEDYLDFVKMAVQKADDSLHTEYISDPEQAIALLDSSKGSPSLCKAKLILLDYYLPGFTGAELLKQIRSLPELKHTPVIIFSTSDNPQDIREAYKNGANAYLVKPTGLKNLNETMQLVCDFWLHTNKGYGIPE